MNAAAPMVDLALTLAGEQVLLMPERALFHPAAGILYVSDLHLGKHATLRALGVPLPGGSAGDLARLSQAITRSGAQRLIILGDLMHAEHSRDRDTLAAFAAWRAAHPELPVLLVRGNHDCHAGDPPADWRITCVSPPHWENAPAAFTLVHDPEEANGVGGFALAGHLHPAALIEGQGRQQIKLPCFWQWAHGMVMPAFSTFVAGGRLPRRPGEHLYAVTDSEVFAL